MDCVWQTAIPDSLLLEIFSHLGLDDLGCVAQVCTRWMRVGTDDSLWQKLARRIWKIKGPLLPQRSSWKDEVKRLYYHTPVIETKCIDKHTDEVLDAAISNNGKYFCTVSKDSNIILWDVDDPNDSIREVNTSTDLDWNLTQYSLFNKDDSLVLVCGVRNLTPEQEMNEPNGVGAVYTIPDLRLVALFYMEPFTLFGTWLDNRIFIAGLSDQEEDYIHMRAYSCDDVISQGVSYKPAELLEYYAKHQIPLFTYEGSRLHQMNVMTAKVPGHHSCDTQHLSQVQSAQCDIENTKSNKRTCVLDGKNDMNTDMDVCETFDKNMNAVNTEANMITDCVPIEQIDTSVYDSNATGVDTETLGNPPSGFKTYMMLVAGEHDEIQLFEVPDEYIEGLREQFATKCYIIQTSYANPSHTFHINDSYITGLCLSPDNRYAYFNHRSVCHKPGELFQPAERTFSSELKVGMIDLVAMEMVKDIEYKGHVGFSNDSPWYICLDISQDFIVSGSEDGRGYLWEKNYNTCLDTLNHTEGVVNGVAFSPVDQETCITVCDDKLVKVWRSRQRRRDLRWNKLKEQSDNYLRLFENSI